MTEPRWLIRARRYIGQREIKGRRHNPLIVRMWQRIMRPYRDDETPWCAAFVGSILELEGIQSTRSEAARSYQTWGVKLDKPVPGCIVVFWRGSPKSFSGHVAFVDGVTPEGHLICIGGNQGDAVSKKVFLTNRVVAYRWPKGEPLPMSDLKVSEGKYEVSTNEA